jgi:hypothetical protein
MSASEYEEAGKIDVIPLDQISLSAIRRLGISLNQYGMLYNMVYSECSNKWMYKDNEEDKQDLLKRGLITAEGKVKPELQNTLFRKRTPFDDLWEMWPHGKYGPGMQWIALRYHRKECEQKFNRITERGRVDLLLELAKKYVEKLKTNSSLTTLERWLYERSAVELSGIAYQRDKWQEEAWKKEAQKSTKPNLTNTP